MGKRLKLEWIVPLVAILIWFSPLAFVPVPWPDDSAFYFAAKTLFAWPPRWVMLPQAAFEPTYRAFSFNIMPFFSVLIGLGRFIGIDGSHLLKLWPLAFWAGTGFFLSRLLERRGLPKLWTAVIVAGFALDPELHWASVLVRPESLVGLLGLIALSLALFDRDRKTQRIWDPIAGCLALAAYTHFNSIHLVIPIAIALLPRPKRMFHVGALTLLYLSPWILIVILRWNLFIHQMTMQWERLAVRNNWLDSFNNALNALFQYMGSPQPFPPETRYASMFMWLAIFLALILAIALPMLRFKQKRWLTPMELSVVASASWVISALYLWHSKPEVWFVYYSHCALWVFFGFVALWVREQRFKNIQCAYATALTAFAALLLVINVHHFLMLYKDPSWRWSSYHEFVDCVDRKLTAMAGNRGDFEVWCPTFPDITIELSRRHPDWSLTRTNDFHSRIPEALAHGRRVDVMVVTEIWGEQKESVWMSWPEYFLNRLYTDPLFKPNRTTCGKHRWQAFIFAN